MPQLHGQGIVKENKKKEKYVNRLAKESSPYLLQHKNNPVDWYPWGREAFDKAKDALMYDYMYMGTERGRDNLEYMGFKHIETREYIKIPKCGIAFRKDMV